MAEKSTSSRSYTPPKGAPTPPRDTERAERRYLTARRATLQWIAVGVVAAALLVAVFVFGTGTGSGGDGVFHGG